MKVMFLIPPSRFVKNVARDLIYGCWCKGKRIGGIQFPPVSQLQVATVLSNAGHDVVLYDAFNMRKHTEDIKRAIRGFDAVVVLTSTSTINEDSEVLLELKLENHHLKTICYGSHPTFMPLQVIQKKGIDIAVRREPEFIIRDLLEAMSRGKDSWQGTPGITFQSDGEIVSNPDYPFIGNLDMLPFPDWTLLPREATYFNPVVKRIPFASMVTSRGCFGNCIFCTAKKFYGETIRFKSADKVVEEMAILQSQGYREIFFRDELFTVNRQRVVDICRGIKKQKIDLAWICSSRVDLVDLEILGIMKDAGCHMIRFGVESGSQQILDSIKKGTTIKQIREAFAWANRESLDTHAHLMLGCPGETEETVRQTISFIKKIRPTVATFGICTPYPGTELFERVRDIFPDINDGASCDLRNIHTAAFYNQAFTKLSNKQLANSIRRAYRKFYLRPLYISQWIGRLESLSEAKRVFLAGLQLFDFIARGETRVL